MKRKLRSASRLITVAYLLVHAVGWGWEAIMWPPSTENLDLIDYIVGAVVAGLLSILVLVAWDDPAKTEQVTE